MDPIKALHAEMKDLTLWSGIGKKRYERIIKNVDLYNDEELNDLHTWLMDVRYKEYNNLLDIYKMVPEQNWINYELFKIEGLQEQILMKKAKLELCNIWKNPYYPERKIIRKRVNNGKKEESVEEATENSIIGKSV